MFSVIKGEARYPHKQLSLYSQMVELFLFCYTTNLKPPGIGTEARIGTTTGKK